MFGPYLDVPLFYDRGPRNLDLEREFRHYIPAGERPTHRRNTYNEALRRAEIMARVRASAPRPSTGLELRLRVRAWLAELDCRLRSRVLHRPCPEHVTAR